MKKVFAIFTIICVLFGMTAYADFSDVSVNRDSYTAIAVLSAIGIIDGYPDGTFDPEGDITRAEFAVAMCRFLGVDDKTLYPTKTDFTDVTADHWASAHIEMVRGAGIINGVGDDKFEPEENITYEQAVKMVVCALGYAPQADARGGYPDGYIRIGEMHGVSKGLKLRKDNATREIAAQLLFNALSIPNMVQTSFGSVTGPEFSIDNSMTTLYTKLSTLKAEADIISVEDGVVTVEYTGIDETAAENGWYILDGEVMIEIHFGEEIELFALPNTFSSDIIDLQDLKSVTIYFDVSELENIVPSFFVETIK